MLEHTAALKHDEVTFSFCRNQCSCVRSQIARSGDSTQLKFSTFRCLPYLSTWAERCPSRARRPSPTLILNLC